MCKQFLNKKSTPRFTSKSRQHPNMFSKLCHKTLSEDGVLSPHLPHKQSHPPQVNCIENELLYKRVYSNQIW